MYGKQGISSRGGHQISSGIAIARYRDTSWECCTVAITYDLRCDDRSLSRDTAWVRVAADHRSMGEKQIIREIHIYGLGREIYKGRS